MAAQQTLLDASFKEQVAPVRALMEKLKQAYSHGANPVVFAPSLLHGSQREVFLRIVRRLEAYVRGSIGSLGGRGHDPAILIIKNNMKTTVEAAITELLAGKCVRSLSTPGFDAATSDDEVVNGSAQKRTMRRTTRFPFHARLLKPESHTTLHFQLQIFLHNQYLPESRAPKRTHNEMSASTPQTHNRADRPIIKRGAWTIEERACLHLACTEYNLRDDELVAILHAANPQFKQQGRNYNFMHFRDEWKHRFKDGRPKMWKMIDKKSYDPEEYTEFEVQRAKTVAAASVLGVVLRASTAKNAQKLYSPVESAPGLASTNLAVPAIGTANSSPSLTGEEAPASSDGKMLRFRPDTQQSAPKIPPNVLSSMNSSTQPTGRSFATTTPLSRPEPIFKTSGAAKRKANTPATDHPSTLPQAMDSNPTPQPPHLHLQTLPLRTLNMLHFMTLDLFPEMPPGLRVASHTSDRFRDNSPIYNHGGQVLRIFFPSTQLEEDVMVCDTTVCTQCNPAADAEGMGRNLPFVHFERDCRMEGWEVGMFQPRLEQRFYEFEPLHRGGLAEVGFVGEGNVWVKVNHGGGAGSRQRHVPLRGRPLDPPPRLGFGSRNVATKLTNTKGARFADPLPAQIPLQNKDAAKPLHRLLFNITMFRSRWEAIDYSGRHSRRNAAPGYEKDDTIAVEHGSCTHASTHLLSIQHYSSPTSQGLLSTMSGRWWREERIALHILFTEFDLTLDQIYDIFGRFSGEALREEDAQKFNGRWLDSRSQTWNDIEKPNVKFGNVNNLTQQEQDERTRVRDDIIIIAADVGGTNWLREEADGNIVPPNAPIVLNPRVLVFRPTMPTAAEVAIAAEKFPRMHR
ncbi:uncharacterized protein MYCGRDRAFT_94709 [Zymoseptoria tritici IPO323]|uniref:Uncharacterized protein n=1 Tax=Zymoseptoria tritici (strain CBS 115943 / IPO323) TaxID=336722 RepID=F9XGT6_ZYMTI|nr:uncharacterized protein MYCGRDRAFT_94709 [Zymoseptoria tritici IPO323]EGP85980.1 hypothetical protein MYCGRDRAFT_94709 [Zymoseptoria tritici IPO323]